MITVDNEIDFLSNVFDFIHEFTGISEDVIFRGYQNKMVLPDDDEFCIFTPINRIRVGTNKRSFNAIGVPDTENGTERETQGVSIDVQIDFWGENASRYAQAIQTAAGSLMANDFFKKNGQAMALLSADNPRNLTAIDETQQYNARWSITCRFLIETSISKSEAWFEDVTFVAIKNVDVYFPPND